MHEYIQREERMEERKRNKERESNILSSMSD
jgi:hypothetical protein